DSIGFTGGLNIGEEYEGKNPAIGRWRDTFVRIEGPAVLDLNIVFCEDWLFATDELIEPELVPPLMDDGAIVQIVSSGPDREWEDILIHYFVAITSAKHTCYITTPYFVPVMSIRTALISAAMRGVDVRLLLPGYNDSKILALASHSYYDELIRAGIRIYEFQDGFLHAKTICIDAEYGSVGSANMDPRSLRLSFEINAFIYQTAFARQLHNMFLKDLEHTCEITLNDLIQKRLPRRLAESVVRLASPLL
ncbi:MAG: phospholipase D-like domain-containing protein, partial [Proteobacteria bacterium]|nr:phospholipase D-like domain-containing protein [Pseudomonadota bacterium]